MKQFSRSFILCFLFMMSLALTSCGKSQDSGELQTYRTQMDTAFQNISDINETMNSIDTESETATDDLLACFDSLETELSDMATLTAPSQFSSVDKLADEAYENMTTANELYHEAFSNGSYNEYTAKAAGEYYARVNKRLQYIIQILHGETPEGDGVTVTMESGTKTSLPDFEETTESTDN